MAPLSLPEIYRHYILAHNFNTDPAQEKLLIQLQDLFDELSRFSRRPRYFLGFLKKKPSKLISKKGVYLWGGVGRGKTLLLDLFFHYLPIRLKKRLHFHEFMRDVQVHLSELSNTTDPLEKIARHYTRDIKLIYLDEFHVTDIGDAMILSELLKHLLDLGVALMMTSNAPPQQLYKNGLQREHFLPTIELIESNLKVLELQSAGDYRLRLLSRTRLYNVPAGKRAEQVLEDNFKKLTSSDISENIQLEINSYRITAKKVAGGIVWFDFDAICGSRRSSSDYLEIAKCYETVLVSDVPVFKERDDLARRFINMIDTFYDHRVRLIVSAGDMPGRLYRRGRLAGDFCRTASRLIEMQSSDYIARGHDA